MWLQTINTVAAKHKHMTNLYEHMQKHIHKHDIKVPIHSTPDHQSFVEAARQQCWGARSDGANRKQAAICIPGQAVQHNTDTETDNLWPKTIHLPSPRDSLSCGE